MRGHAMVVGRVWPAGVVLAVHAERHHGALLRRRRGNALGGGRLTAVLAALDGMQTISLAVPLAGCGMGKRELSEWAVMNLSMEDRGAAPQEADCAHGPTQRNGPDRFLSGNLSYFGVRPLPACLGLLHVRRQPVPACCAWLGCDAWQDVACFFLAHCLTCWASTRYSQRSWT